MPTWSLASSEMTPSLIMQETGLSPNSVSTALCIRLSVVTTPLTFVFSKTGSWRVWFSTISLAAS